MAWYFVCSEGTRDECFTRKLFGDNEQKDVQEGDTLFLYDYDDRVTYGPFTAETAIQRNIVPKAWNGNFDWQVRVGWDQLYKIDGDDLPHVDFDEEIPPNKTDNLIHALRNQGQPWSPEGEVRDSPQELKEEIQKLDEEIHKLAHRIEEARMPNSGHPADREVNVDRLKGEFYSKMNSFVWAVRKFDEQTGQFELPSNQ